MSSHLQVMQPVLLFGTLFDFSLSFAGLHNRDLSQYSFSCCSDGFDRLYFHEVGLSFFPI